MPSPNWRVCFFFLLQCFIYIDKQVLVAVMVVDLLISASLDAVIVQEISGPAVAG